MSGVNFVQEGLSIDYTPAVAVTAGDVVVQGELVGVAKKDIAADALGALAVEGVFDFPKAVLSSSAITVGAKCYWDDTNDVATTSSGGNKLLGKAVIAATATATTVRIKMNQ